MPPLTGLGERQAPRATWFCIDERDSSQVALALRVYPSQSRVGPSGIACSALLACAGIPALQPRLKFPGCLMSLRLLFPAW